QQFQGHPHHHPHHSHHHRSHSSNGFFPHPSHVHSAPATPLQPSSGHPHHHHLQHHHTSNTSNGGERNGMSMTSQDSSSSYGYFGPNGSSSPPMVMPTPTPRVHSSQPSQPGRRPASLYNLGSHGQHPQTQQFQSQKPGSGGLFQPQHPSLSPSSSSSAHYGQSPSHGAPAGHSHGHGHGHSHSNSFSHPAGPYGMDIILPATSASAAPTQRPCILPPPISTMQQPRASGQSLEEYEESRRSNRHERTMSEGHPAGYMSPSSISPISPTPERHMDVQYRDGHEEDSPSSATQSTPFTNGSNSNRHSASLGSFGLQTLQTIKSEETEPAVVPRQSRPTSAYYANAAQATVNRRSYDDALYDEHQQLMRDNFNMDTRLVISEEEPRPESAIDLLAYAAAFIQESEEHKNDSKDGEERRDGLGQLNLSNKRQSFHGRTGYPSKEPFQEDATMSSRYSSSSSNMNWEASSPVGSTNDVMPVPRRRGGDDAPYTARRPRPVTYGGSGYLYDHQENQFMPQSPSSSLLSHGRSSTSSSTRRISNRNSGEVGNSQLLLQRGLTRPRRSSSTATSGIMGHHISSSSMPVLPPIINENRLLSSAIVPSPPFGASRLARHDSSQGNNTRDSPGSDSYSRDSYNESHTSRDDMEDIEDEETEFQRQRAAKRRSGNVGSFFGMGVK
ncbi:hypothetical protein BGZ51_007172, partial [Haplosporangium sp. Z 767]